MNDLENHYNVNMFLHYNKFVNTMELSQIVVPKESRNQGIGKEVLNKLCDFADRNDIRITLTPSSSFGGNKNKLIKFYRNFGFQPNRDLEISDDMVRFPKQQHTV